MEQEQQTENTAQEDKEIATRNERIALGLLQAIATARPDLVRAVGDLDACIEKAHDIFDKILENVARRSKGNTSDLNDLGYLLESKEPDYDVGLSAEPKTDS